MFVETLFTYTICHHVHVFIFYDRLLEFWHQTLSYAWNLDFVILIVLGLNGLYVDKFKSYLLHIMPILMNLANLLCFLFIFICLSYFVGVDAKG